MKKKRIVNKELIKQIGLKPCLICGLIGVDVDHIKTKGSGGDDVPENLWPLCRKHHFEKHRLGIASFITKYPRLKKELLFMGWNIVDEFGQKKLRRI